MKLFLIFHGRFPSDKAASLFAAKSAEAFAGSGLDVTLIVPKRSGIVDEDPYVYYSIERNFKIEYIKTFDFYKNSILKPLAFWLSYISFSLFTRIYLKRNSRREDIIYSNEILPLALASKIRKNCFYEMHDFPESKIWLFGKYLTKMKWILIHNRWKMEEAKRLFPTLDQKRLIYEPNAVDLKDFDIEVSKLEARKQLGLSENKKIIIYTGHLYGWKGVYTLAESAKLLSSDYEVIFVGGTDKDVSTFRQKYGSFETIKIVGHVKHSLIPVWQKAGDILILPNTAKERISAFYTSPMKLFEYMASRRPIIATDIPSIREILNNKNAIIVEADNPEKMKQTIVEAFEQEHQSQTLAERAFEDVANHTWHKRADRVINFIKLNA